MGRKRTLGVCTVAAATTKVFTNVHWGENGVEGGAMVMDHS